MSVLAELTVFPTGKTGGLSPYVSRVVKLIKNSGLSYNFGPMGTCVEGEWDEVMELAGKCYRELEPDCDRVYIVMKMDCRKGASDRINGKVASVEKKISAGL